MKNLKLQLMALGLLATGTALGDFFSDLAGKAAAPVTSTINAKLQPAARAIADAKGGVAKAVMGMNEAVNQLNDIIDKVKAMKPQVASGAQQAQQIWAAAAPAVAGALAQIKSLNIPQGTTAVEQVQKGASVAANATHTASSGLEKAAAGIALVQNGLGYVKQGTDPMRDVGEAIKGAASKIYDASTSVNLDSLGNIAASIGDIGKQVTVVAGIVDRLVGSVGAILTESKELATQTDKTFIAVGDGMSTIAK
jgi:uncharacterized phage infection (PIP) family protein YhgE